MRSIHPLIHPLQLWLVRAFSRHLANLWYLSGRSVLPLVVLHIPATDPSETVRTAAHHTRENGGFTEIRRSSLALILTIL